jgi:hypothetical protein
VFDFFNANLAKWVMAKKTKWRTNEHFEKDEPLRECYELLPSSVDLFPRCRAVRDNSIQLNQFIFCC